MIGLGRNRTHRTDKTNKTSIRLGLEDGEGSLVFICGWRSGLKGVILVRYEVMVIGAFLRPGECIGTMERRGERLLTSSPTRNREIDKG